MLHPRARGLQRRVAVDGLLGEVALHEAHGLPVDDVDGRVEDHCADDTGTRVQMRVKFSSRRRPGRRRLLGVELDAEHAARRDRGHEALAVGAVAEHDRRRRPGARPASARGRTRLPSPSPSTSGDAWSPTRRGSSRCAGASAHRRASRTSPAEDPEAVGPAELGRAVEQQLHAEADAQQRPAFPRPAEDRLDEAALAQVAHRLRERADARQHEPVGAVEHRRIVAHARPRRRRARAPCRPTGGCPSRSRSGRCERSDSRGQRPLRRWHAGLGRVDRDRGPQRARGRLERRLDHVVGVGPRVDRDVQRQLGAVGQRAEELLGQLVVEAAGAAGRQVGLRTRSTGARRCRASPSRAPRPSARPRGRSG